MKFLDELNEEQRIAVEAGDGPLAIVAGPGTGKTKTLTARIAYLLQTGRARPHEILALTFTNKAAREMQGRVKSLLGKASLPKIATFHALCREIITQQMGEAPQFVTETQRHAIIRTLKKSLALSKLSAREISLILTRAKNATQIPKDAPTKRLLAEYQHALQERDLLDFDDLLLQARDLLQDKSSNYRYILVDEFQDTNELQYELLLLLNKTDNVFVIGDPLQSIYGFRGASSAVFDRFKSDFKGAVQVTLTTNYRSTPEVVKMACALFPEHAHLKARNDKPGKVCAVEVLNEYTEADWVVGQIERHIGGSDLLKGSEHHTAEKARTFGDFAVLYRTHHVARIVRERLDAAAIPYQVAGEGSPYHLPAIACTIEALRRIAGRQPVETPGLKLSPTQLKLKTDQKVSELAQTVAKKCGFDSKTEPALRQFLNSLVRFDEQGLDAALDHLESIAEQDFYDPSADAVTLSTIHAAKGLEFTHVFLIAAEQGIIPHLQSSRPTSLEEERRLFYVAVTRAREQLDITYTQTRARKPASPSQFITEIAEELLPRQADEAIATQKRKADRRRQKRAQTSLF
ncbi:MAG: ATP-dependent helicase [Candidatus Saccharimonadales bacterium]